MLNDAYGFEKIYIAYTEVLIIPKFFKNSYI